MAEERKGAVTMRGNPMTLVGPEIKVGQKAPNFNVVGKGMAPATLDQFKGKVKIITTIPSIDTPVCDAETRRFNVEASNLPGDVQILSVSMDLPFAQARWCGAAGVDKVTTLSDWRSASFGTGYGALIKELHLLAMRICRGQERQRDLRRVRQGNSGATQLRSRACGRKESRCRLTGESPCPSLTSPFGRGRAATVGCARVRALASRRIHAPSPAPGGASSPGGRGRNFPMDTSTPNRHAFTDALKRGLYEAIFRRRDIREFISDPIRRRGARARADCRPSCGKRRLHAAVGTSSSCATSSSAGASERNLRTRAAKECEPIQRRAPRKISLAQARRNPRSSAQPHRHLQARTLDLPCSARPASATSRFTRRA